MNDHVLGHDSRVPLVFALHVEWADGSERGIFILLKVSLLQVRDSETELLSCRFL